jgi:hypothetical protein
VRARGEVTMTQPSVGRRVGAGLTGSARTGTGPARGGRRSRRAR